MATSLLWKSVLCILFSLNCALLSTGLNIISEYFMQSGSLGSCDETISGKSSAYIRSHVGAGLVGIIKYKSNEACRLQFVGAEEQLLVQFLKVDLQFDGVSGCSNDGLSVYDTNDVDELPKTTICGNPESPVPFVSTGRNISLYFFSDATDERTGFSLLVTSFRKRSTCAVLEFQCDTNRCINRKLMCDGVKHCVDGTDEDKVAAECSWVELAVGSVLSLGEYGVMAIAILSGAVIFTAFTTIMLWRCVRSNKDSNLVAPDVVDSKPKTTAAEKSANPPPKKAWSEDFKTLKTKPKVVTVVEVEQAPEVKVSVPPTSKNAVKSPDVKSLPEVEVVNDVDRLLKDLDVEW